MVCYSVVALQEFFMLFLEMSDCMEDESQNSWSSDLIQKFYCMMEACFSLGFLYFEYSV